MHDPASRSIPPSNSKVTPTPHPQTHLSDKCLQPAEVLSLNAHSREAHTFDLDTQYWASPYSRPVDPSFASFCKAITNKGEEAPSVMQGWPEERAGAPVLRDFDDPLDGHPRYEKIRWANPDKPNVQVALDRMRNRNVAVKFIERGSKVTKHVRREILHHHSLVHENVIRFYDAFLTPRYLAIVMELGEMNLWQYVINRGGRLAEEEARDFFRQLIIGLDYCHSKGVANRWVRLGLVRKCSSQTGCVSFPHVGFGPQTWIVTLMTEHVLQTGWILTALSGCGG